MEEKIKIPFSRKQDLNKYQKHGMTLIDNLCSEYFLNQPQLTEEIQSKYTKRLKTYLKQCLVIFQNSTVLYNDSSEEQQENFQIKYAEVDQDLLQVCQKQKEQLIQNFEQFISEKKNLLEEIDENTKELFEKQINLYNQPNEKLVIHYQDEKPISLNKMAQLYAERKTIKQQYAVEKLIQMVENFDHLQEKHKNRIMEEYQDLKKLMAFKNQGLI